MAIYNKNYTWWAFSRVTYFGAAMTAGENLVAHISAAPCRNIAFEEPKILLPTEASPHPAQFALRARPAVAHNIACVTSAGEGFPAGLVAVPLPSPADNFFGGLPARALALHLDLTRATLALMAHPLARVLSAGKQFPADLPT